MAGRFSHEAAIFDPITGSIFLTEDNFGFGSGFYRYDPPVDPRRPAGSRTAGRCGCSASPARPRPTCPALRCEARRTRSRWIPIDDPDPQFPMDGGAPDGHQQPSHLERRQAGLGRRRRSVQPPRGLTWDKGVIYFTATQGGGDPEAIDWDHSAESFSPPGFGRGTGQVWAYHPQRSVAGGRLPIGEP